MIFYRKGEWNYELHLVLDCGYYHADNWSNNWLSAGFENGKEIFGTLRMDHSDIEEPPYLFLELKGHTVDDISRQKFVTFAVEPKDFLPRN